MFYSTCLSHSEYTSSNACFDMVYVCDALTFSLSDKIPTLFSDFFSFECSTRAKSHIYLLFTLNPCVNWSAVFELRRKEEKMNHVIRQNVTISMRCSYTTITI